jgi:hypothetical protein
MKKKVFVEKESQKNEMARIDEMNYYKNKKTGDIVEHDGMLFMSQPPPFSYFPKIKFIENGEVKMMQWPTFLEEYELLEENEMTLKLDEKIVSSVSLKNDFEEFKE